MISEPVGFAESVAVEVVRAHQWYWQGWLVIAIIAIISIILIRRRNGVKAATAIKTEDKNENIL